jgi:hypothetical protein
VLRQDKKAAQVIANGKKNSMRESIDHFLKGNDMTKTRQKTTSSNKSAQTTQKKHVGDKKPPLADELVQLNDDFAEFSEISAFLCHAFATALSDHEWLDQEIISGARRCSNWLQRRTCELKDDIRHVHTRYVAEHEETASPSCKKDTQ